MISLAQVGLGLLVVATGIHVTRRLHDAIPSTIRGGVASGVSALSWTVFVPFSIVFGLVSREYGVHVAGWLIAVVAAFAGGVLIKVVVGGRDQVVPAEIPDPAGTNPAVVEGDARVKEDLRCDEFVEQITDFLDGTLDPEVAARFTRHLAACAGCAPYLDQVRRTIRALAGLDRPGSSR